MFSENETLLHATKSNTILQFLIYHDWGDLNTDGTHMKWLLNNSVGIIKSKINNYPIIDSMTIVDSTWINFNHCHSHMFISEMIAIKLISVNMNLKMLIMM